MKNLLPHECISTFIITYAKQTHCKNVHCNSEHVLTLFSIAVCSHGEHHQESRLPCHTNTKQRMYMKKPYRHRCINYNHRAVVSLFGFAHAHDGHVAQVKQEHRSINHIRRGSWHAQRRQRSCDTLDNLKRSCSLRRQQQGRSRPSTALHVVCTNRVALFQGLLCWPTV